MNAILDPALDHCGHSVQHYHNRAMPAFQEFIFDFSLIDLFRAINSTFKKYSFYSNRHQSYSTIDYLLTNPKTFSQIHHVNILPCPLSDHNIVIAKLALVHTPPKVTRWRFNTTLLINAEYCTYFREAFKLFISENIGSTNDPQILWGAIKGCIRNSAISYSSHLNKTRLCQIIIMSPL